MANEFYVHGLSPAQVSALSSATMRAEFDLITAGFDKLPVLAANGNKAVVVNAGATALTVTTGTLALAGNLSTAAAFTTSGAFALTLTTTGITNVTLPTSGTLLSTAATITVAQGGTGATTLTNHGVLLGQATSVIVATAAGGANTFLAGVAGADPTFRAVDVSTADVTGILPTARGGTGIATGYPLASNLALNPNWLIDQVNEGTLYTVTGGGADVQLMDGWSGSGVAAPGVFKARRLADPDNAALKCCEITCTTIDAAIAATDAYYLHTSVIGDEAAQLMIGTALAQSLAIKFKFKSNVNGTFGVSLANSALNRSYVLGTLVVLDANEAEYTFTLPMDTAGTWLYDTGVGLRLRICLAAGANFQTTAGSWGANNMLTTSAQVNFMSSVANVAYLKLIQIVPGVTPLTFLSQDYAEDLRKAQRYQLVYDNTSVNQSAVGQCYSTTAADVTFSFPVDMRASGTMTVTNANMLLRKSAGASEAVTATAITANSPRHCSIRVNTAGNMVAGDATALYLTGTGNKIVFNARLS